MKQECLQTLVLLATNWLRLERKIKAGGFVQPWQDGQILHGMDQPVSLLWEIIGLATYKLLRTLVNREHLCLTPQTHLECSSRSKLSELH